MTGLNSINYGLQSLFVDDFEHSAFAVLTAALTLRIARPPHRICTCSCHVI